MARVNEAKKTSQASAHYRQTLCSKVRHEETSWSPRRVWNCASARGWHQRFALNVEPGKWANTLLYAYITAV